MKNTYQEILVGLLSKMPQEELARELGADQATISRWKAGRIPANLDKGVRLMALARKHGIATTTQEASNA